MSVSVSRRFCGPDESANGGWFSGAVADSVGRAHGASVRLLSPPPLEREIQVVPDGAGHLAQAGDVEIARLGAADPLESGDLPTPTSHAHAKEVGPMYAGLQEHPFPHCFVCGTDRDGWDALCLRPGPVSPGVLAAAWRPREMSVPMVWSALDCPGGWALGVGGRPMVLGTITAQIHQMPQIDEALVVMAWAISSQGRKHTAGTALYSGDQLLAQARSVWIAVDPGDVRPA